MLNKKVHMHSLCSFFPKNRRGQFYLIAALAIVSLAAGLILVTNNASTVQNPGIGYLKNEIIAESSNIISYGTYNGLSNNQVESMLENLSEYYVNNSAQSNLYFLFGTKSNETFVAYQSQGGYNVSVNGSEIDGIGTGAIYKQIFLSPENPISIKINGTAYTFKLNEGENFHFVVKSLSGEQDYTISG